MTTLKYNLYGEPDFLKYCPNYDFPTRWSYYSILNQNQCKVNNFYR